MSFDGLELGKVVGNGTGFNPFGTGQCLSTLQVQFVHKDIHVSIPLEQGNVFRQISFQKMCSMNGSQSLWNRAMSFDLHTNYSTAFQIRSQSLWNRAMSFDQGKVVEFTRTGESQSLWNRAMSFDMDMVFALRANLCLNPFGTGQCLSTHLLL